MRITEQRQNGLAKKIVLFIPLSLGSGLQRFFILQLVLQPLELFLRESAFWQASVAIFTALSSFEEVDSTPF
jgi:hypothetical protein